MRFYEFNIIESQGGIFRRAQEVSQGAEVKFKHAETNKEISLQSADMLPPSGTFETELELDNSLQDYLNQKGVKLQNVQFTGNPKTAKAVLVSIWKDLETNQLISFVKLVKKPGEGAAPVKQTNAEFKKTFGYGAQGKTAQRATLKLKPKDVTTADSWINYRQIPNMVQTKVSSRTDLDEVLKLGLIELVKNVAAGNSAPVEGMAQYESSLEIDFGETAAPIALITGNFVGGDYASAEENLLKPLGLTWKSLSQVLYPSAGDEKLYDSYIKLDKNNSLRVSSKDKKGGAAASITGLVDAVNKTPEKYQDIFENKKFVPIFEILKTISNPENRYWKRKNKGVNGPLILGVDRFKFITEEEARMIVDLMGKSIRIPPNQAVEKGLITSNLYTLSEVKGAKFNDPAYNLGFHMMACVAKKIANTVNQDKNVGDLFRSILERSNMIQVKTTVKSSDEAATFSNFEVIYPPIFTGTFQMVADNNYMATRMPIAPLSFAIK